MIDLDGKTIVPGFTDSLCHILGAGEREMNLNLEETNALENFVAKIKSAPRRLSATMVTGRGWIETFSKSLTAPVSEKLGVVAR